MEFIGKQQFIIHSTKFAHKANSNNNIAYFVSQRVNNNISAINFVSPFFLSIEIRNLSEHRAKCIHVKICAI
jgi:hypothetical protein